MKIRTRTLLGIVPLFAGLGLVIGSLVFYLERRETAWGLTEEGRSLAVTLAAFLQEEDLPALARLAAEKPDGGEGSGPLGKVLRWRRAVRMMVFQRPEGTVLLDLGARDRGAVEPWTAADLRALERGEVTARRVERDNQGGRVLVTLAPIRDRSGRMTAVVCVQTDANALVAQAGHGLRQAGSGLGIGLLLGLACALLISHVLEERVQILAASMARATHEPDAAMVVQHGIISEINDLGNTFSTMISVMHGVIGKTRRHLLDLEMYRTESNLAEAFEENYWTPKAQVRGEMTFIVRRVEGGRRGAFIDLIETDTHLYGVAGRSAEPGELAAVRKASATQEFLRQQSARRDLESGLEMTALLFDVAALQLLDWNGDAGTLTVHTYRREEEAFRAEAVAIQPGEYRVFHDLGEEMDRRFAIYIRRFRPGSAMALMDELLQIVRSVDPVPHGTLMLAGRQG